MTNNYLHYKKNNLNFLYLIASMVLIVFGFYKNGILLYKEFNNKLILFRPLIYPAISILVSLLLTVIKNKKITLTDNIIYMLVLSLCIPIKTGILLFLIFDVICNILLEFVVDRINIKINYIALFKLVLIGILLANHNYSYFNKLEVVGKYSYNVADIFIGRGISGVCSSSILFILLAYALFNTNYYYKKEIPFISFGAYIIPVLIFKIFLKKVIIINSLIIFSLIFIAPLSKYSPTGIKERIIYSIMVGLLTFIFTYYINMYEGVILAIFASSFINYLNLK